MIVEAIDRVLGLAVPNISTHGELEYTDKNLEVIAPPLVEAVQTDTLQGLVDLCAAGMDGISEEEILVHVRTPLLVEIISIKSDDYGRRRVWARAKFPSAVKQFPFGGFMSIESFIIGVQAGFQRASVEKPDGGIYPDLDYVVQMASKITNENVQVSEDDGISQKVAVRAGVALRAQESIKPRVLLAPYRTFTEIDQVLSEFVFRARLQHDEVQLALFEADGGRWCVAAMKAIAAWLDDQFDKAQVIS